MSCIDCFTGQIGKSLHFGFILSLWLCASVGLAIDDPIPLLLPRVDGKPVDASKPVKVYVLAGQSNMVGMGDIKGARPQYSSILLSADSAVIPGKMPIGNSGLERFGIFQSAEAGAPPGGVVRIYLGQIDPQANFENLKPTRTVEVALGDFDAQLPSIAEPHTLVATAWLEVPRSGLYTIHPGFGPRAMAIAKIDGREVYRLEMGRKPKLEKVQLEAGRRYPLSVTFLQGGSAVVWLEQVDLVGKGDLVTLTSVDKRFTYLVDEEGGWAVRPDVYYQEARLATGGNGSPLSAVSNGNSIGPELGFGWVMGTFHDEHVLLIKTAQGNRSLGFDFRPPSSGRTQPDNEFEGLEYRLMVKGVRETLEKIDQLIPGWQGQGYELAGFCWFQGHKDSGAEQAEYERHLCNLINDFRKEFERPNLPAVVATVGFNGYRIAEGPWHGIWAAQMAVGDQAQHPEFAGTVASVDTRDFWREVEESPRSQDYHYHRNPETYLLVGEAMGRAMVRLQGGTAVEIPKSDQEAQTAKAVAAERAKPVPTEEQQAASMRAIKPLILDGVLATWMADPRNQPSLEAAVKAVRPARPTTLLNDAIDEVVRHYQLAGISDYDWKPLGGELRDASWDYFSFDLPAGHDRSKGVPDLNAVLPAEQKDWFTPGFDSAEARWRVGNAPFGQSSDHLSYPDWIRRLTSPPRTVCEHEVLLLRKQVDLPPPRPGYRYRIRVNGSAHPNSGEAFAIYLNGRLLAESKSGIVAWRREAHLPRGSHVWPDFLDELKQGTGTLAVASLPMDNWPTDRPIPHRAHLSVWLEEMKLPPLE